MARPCDQVLHSVVDEADRLIRLAVGGHGRTGLTFVDEPPHVPQYSCKLLAQRSQTKGLL